MREDLLGLFDDRLCTTSGCNLSALLGKFWRLAVSLEQRDPGTCEVGSRDVELGSHRSKRLQALLKVPGGPVPVTILI